MAVAQRIHDDRQAMGVGDVDDRREGCGPGSQVGTGEVEDGGGAVRDRRCDLPREGLEHVADLRHPGPGELDREVVRVSLAGEDHDVSTLGGERVLHVPPDRQHVVTGDACERREKQSRRRPAGNVRSLVPGQFRDPGRDRSLELEHVDE